MGIHPDNAYPIVGIDPGTDTLGYALLHLDVHSPHLELVYATTLHGSVLAKQWPQVAATHGARAARLHGLCHALKELFKQHWPLAIIAESPYLGRLPRTYAALTEALFSVRQAVMAYDPLLSLEQIDPAQVKSNLGVSGKSGDKSLMTAAVNKLVADGLLLDPNGLIPGLDEHGIDATGVAYFLAKQRRAELIESTASPPP